MQISEGRNRLAGAIVAVFLASGAPAFALDPVAGIGEDTPPAKAFEMAAQAYRAGNTDEALKALEFAAGKGYAKAQWELARRYADGDGVKRNALKAFEYFRILADQHAEDNPFLSTARIISGSFVKLSGYYLSGIPDTGVAQDVSQAFNLLRHAATYFGDPDAQYRLGKMYLEGKKGPPNIPIAVKWIKLAAQKNHTDAQAELGRLFFLKSDNPKDKRRGLTYLELARRKADPIEQAWIIESHDWIFASVDELQRQKAVAAADRWIKKNVKRR